MAQATELKLKSKSKLLEGLNAEQEKAVTHKDGPLLIVAGAGTGKTTVITRRIAYLIEQGVKPEEILALAFGEKAAGEMEERVDPLVATGFVNIHISTFHSFGEQILKEYGLEVGLPDFKVLDEVGQWLLVRNNLDKFDLDYYRPLGNPTKFILAMITHFSRLKDELISPEEYLDYAEKVKLNSVGAETQITSPNPSSRGGASEIEEPKRLQEIANAYHVYNKLLLENSALDFGDLINYTLELFKKRPRILELLQNRFKYILVDEFQDTNLAQYGLLKLLTSPKNNITVVGDDDQSIFKFRGASISNILHFQKDYPQSQFISLTDNYRSGQKILDAAYDFIQLNNPDRLEVKLKLPKKLKSQQKGQAEILHLNALDYLTEVDMVINKILELKSASGKSSADTSPAEPVRWSDFAVLARSHSTLEPFLNKFDALQIPYIYFANKGLYNKPIILDILAYFRLLDNYHESPALYRVLKFPEFNISSQAIVELSAFARRKSLSLYQVLKQAGTLDIDEQSLAGVRKLLDTLHGHAELAKSKSAGQVYVQTVNDLHFAKLVNFDSHEGLQNGNYLETFRRRILDFQNESPDKSLKTFLNAILLEQEAGEEGDLKFDPEAGPEIVKFMTVHAAKGLEFAYVFVVGLVDKRFPTIERREPIEIPVELVREFLPEGDFHLEEERRLFYVAMTRAKLGLYLTSAEDYGGKRKKRPSMFLHDLGLVEESLPSKATGKVQFNRTPLTPLYQRGEGGVKIPLPKSFYFSQISSFKKCPLEYKYQYIIKLPTPGSGNLSFGSSIHRTFEKYLNLYRQSLESQDLFGKASLALPPFETLKKLYEECWIDDWYADSRQMSDFKILGEKILKEFYNECAQNLPKPKYLEKGFRLKLGNYYFTGKIDRGDEVPDGLLLIDYKTGAPRPMEKVEKQQLLIYQWAAAEAWGEKVSGLEYWYFQDGLDKKAFLGGEKEIDSMKEELIESIEKIVECIKTNNFLEIDQQTHDRSQCDYRDLE